MKTQDSAINPSAPSTETPDFSLVLGGPLYQLFQRAYLSGTGLELLHRRMIFIPLLLWLPAFLLSMMDGYAFGGSIHIPFLWDVEAHARILVALPALIFAELVVHRRISPLVRRFIDRGIVTPEDYPAFNKAVDSALRIRNSTVIEVALLLLVYTVGVWTWKNQIAVGSGTWFAVPTATGMRLTSAGLWYSLVSIPIFQFFLLRWLIRSLIWFQLLWRISRLKLRLYGAHPDRAGGIGFLGGSTYAFGPILFAQGTVLSGLIASRVLFEGQALLSFKMEAAGLVGAMVLFVMGPLLMFSPQMDRAQRKSDAEFGLLANDYLFQFEDKWIRKRSGKSNELLGTGDIQSLADLGNSCSVVSDMRIVPFSIKHVGRLVFATAAPLIPLTLTVISLEDLLSRLAKIIL
jgi:hypothetical protein